MSLIKDFTKGIWTENPVYVLVLGLCPTLATTTSVENALGMGAASTFVLICSNIIISIFNRFFPKSIRIPCFIVVIASFVTIVQMLMGAYLPSLNASLGLFIPLIVVNCIILGRAEAFASKNNVLSSFFDGLGMGIGFTLALTIIGSIREISGTGCFYGIPITSFYGGEGSNILAPSVMISAPGAFIVLGLLLAIFKWQNIRKLENSKQTALAKQVPFENVVQAPAPKPAPPKTDDSQNSEPKSE